MCTFEGTVNCLWLKYIIDCLDAEPYLIYEFIEQTLQPGPPVCLKCSCRGSPTPQITWLKNGLSLPPSERWTPSQNQRTFLLLVLIPCNKMESNTAKNQYLKFETNIRRKGFRGHCPNFHIHMSMRDLYIPTIDLSILLQEICGTVLGIYKSLTLTWLWK